MSSLGNAARQGGHEHRGGRRLWLIRHGETAGNSSVRYYGSTDVPLSDEGREQVRRLGPLVAPQRFAALVHSPLSRAVESAQLVAAALSAPPGVLEAEPLLREVDFGDLEGHTAADIAVELPEFYAEWQAGRVDVYPGGESIEGFRRRIGAGLDAVLDRHPDGDLCLVVHRGVVKDAFVHLLGLSWDTVRAWSLDLGSATILVHHDTRFVLDRYNLVGP